MSHQVAPPPPTSHPSLAHFSYWASPHPVLWVQCTPGPCSYRPVFLKCPLPPHCSDKLNIHREAVSSSPPICSLPAAFPSGEDSLVYAASVGRPTAAPIPVHCKYVPFPSAVGSQWERAVLHLFVKAQCPVQCLAYRRLSSGDEGPNGCPDKQRTSKGTMTYVIL